MGDQGSLSSFHRDIGIPINFQEVSSLISQRGGCLIRFLELRQEPVVYSRVTVGMDIRNSTLFSEVRTPV